MSETTPSKEPIHPRTHLEIVRASKMLIASCLAADAQKGHDSTLKVPIDSSIRQPTADTPRKVIYELYPKVTPGWRGRFFTVEGGGAVTHLNLSAPINGSDPEQSICISALFDSVSDEPYSIDGVDIYKTPSKQVILPLAEELPALIENPYLTPVPESFLRVESMTDPEGHDLLHDLQEIQSMQRDI